MPAIVELNDVDRVKLIKLLNNLNLGFIFSGFGEAFVAMLDGKPLTMAEEQKAELTDLINNLNLGFAHLNAGELLVGLLDAKTQKATAAAITVEQTEILQDLLNRLNVGLHKCDVGSLLMTAVPFIANEQARKITAAAAKASATGGDAIPFASMFTLAGGVALGDLDFTVNPASAGKLDAKTGNLTLAADASGKVTVTSALHKGADAVEGAGATFTITLVTPKLKFKTDLEATVSAASGSDVTWTVEATGGKAPYTYQWYWKGDAGDDVAIDGKVNPSAITASLVNSAVDTTSQGTYKCVVTDANKKTISSVGSVLTVTEA